MRASGGACHSLLRRLWLSGRSRRRFSSSSGGRCCANRRFFSLAELNVVIRTLVDDLNARLMRKLGASRREFFDTIDRPALMPLPAEPYQYAEWRRARVAPD